MRTWTAMLLLLAIPATGCTGNAETFWEEVVRLSCRLHKKCLKADFNEHYDDLADCRDDRTDTCSPGEFADACNSYDKDEAGDCLKQTRKQIRKCDSEGNDNDCDPARICGDDADLAAIYACQASLYGDVGAFPQPRLLEEDGLPDLSQLSANDEDADEPNEDE